MVGDKGGSDRSSFVTCGDVASKNGENIITASFHPIKQIMCVFDFFFFGHATRCLLVACACRMEIPIFEPEEAHTSFCLSSVLPLPSSAGVHY